MIMEKTGAIGFITQTRLGCVFQQKPLKSSAVVLCVWFVFLITVLQVGLIICFTEIYYFTEKGLVLSRVTS